VNVRLGLKEKVEAMEELRLGLVTAMKLGSNLAINLDMLQNVNFENDWTMDSYFPLSVFNYEDWRDEVNYQTVVRTKEGIDPVFSIHDKFNMIILCKYESDESLYRVAK
jgi:hypothetical protein